MGVCNCSMFCCTLLYVHSSIAIILMGKRELIVLLNLSSWCLVMVEQLFLVVPRGCVQFVIVVFPDHTHLLFLYAVSGKFDILVLIFRRTKPSVRLAFTVMRSTCGFQDREPEISTPRYLALQDSKTCPCSM